MWPYISGVLALLTLVSVAFAVKFYIELYRWAKLCQNSSVAIAHKNKVKLSATMVEFMLWTNQLKPGERGRTIYALGGTRVALIKGDNPPGRLRQALTAGKHKRSRSEAPRAQQGAWSQDDQKAGVK